MDPLVSEVFADVQAYLGEPPGGDVYTGQMLTPFFGVACRDVFSLMMKWSIPFDNKIGYFVLPARINQAYPPQYYLTDLGEPERLWERGQVQTATIAAVLDTTPIQLTFTGPHNIANGSMVNVFGTPAPDVVGANGAWFATVVDPLNITLNGSVAGGSIALGATPIGTVALSSDRWHQIRPTETLNADPAQFLNVYQWRGDMFWFNGSTEVREIKVEYLVNGNPPTYGNVGISNSRDFLAHRTAALACKSRDEDSFQVLNMMACGETMQPDGKGGFLAALVTPMLLEKQRRGRRQGPFRQRRHAYAYSPFA